MIDALVMIVGDDTLRKLLDSKGFPVSRNTLPVCHCQTWLRFKLELWKLSKKKFDPPPQDNDNDNDDPPPQDF